jgi:hypothetical protein
MFEVMDSCVLLPGKGDRIFRNVFILTGAFGYNLLHFHFALLVTCRIFCGLFCIKSLK